MIVTERAGEERLEELIEIERACFPLPWSARSMLLSLAHKNALCIIATRDNSPAGYVLTTSAAGEAEILKLAVAPSHRGLGIGRRLAEEVVAGLRDSGCTEVFLECRASNLAAIRLYERLGFKVTGERKAYYTSPAEDAVTMRLPLQ